MKNLLKGLLLIPLRVVSTTMVRSRSAYLATGSDGIK